MSEQVLVFDTTMRDGEQCPGAKMSPAKKVAIAKQLAKSGVDIIEAGFPASNPQDQVAVGTIAREVHGPVICAFARATRADIEIAAECLKQAEKRRIHTFVPTSARQMRAKGFSENSAIDSAVSAVCYAKRFTDDVEFTPEDASRSDPEFVCRVIRAAIQAGATTINIADTVGIMLPHQFGAFIAQLRERISNSHRVVWSAHCHNDIGMAVANSVTAIESGVRQIECTVNGIGERAGNAAMEEVVMAIEVHKVALNCHTNIKTTEIAATSQIVARAIGWPIPRNKPIVGQNAFAHEAGIHQDAVMKDPATYEIMRPETVGWIGTKLPIGKHSGRKAVMARIEALGVPASDVERMAREMMKKIKRKNISHVSDEKIREMIGI